MGGQQARHHATSVYRRLQVRGGPAHAGIGPASGAGAWDFGQCVVPLEDRGTTGGIPVPHAPGGARRAGRADQAQTGKRDASEGAGFVNTCGDVFREGIPMRYRAIRSG